MTWHPSAPGGTTLPARSNRIIAAVAALAVVGGTSAWLLSRSTSPDSTDSAPVGSSQTTSDSVAPTTPETTPPTDPDDTSDATLEISVDAPSGDVGESIMLVADASVRAEADTVADLTAIGEAIAAYRSEHGAYPPASLTDADGTPLLSWRVLLLPYLGEQDLYDRFDLTAAWDDPANAALVDGLPDVFRSDDPNAGSADAAAGSTSYAGVAGPKQIFRGGATELTGGVPIAGVVDGDTMTIGVGPLGADVEIPWTAPEDLAIADHTVLGAPDGFDGPAAGTTPLLFLDGTVRSVVDDTPGEVVWSWSTIAGDSCSPPDNHALRPTFAWDLDGDGEPDAFGSSVPFVAEASGSYEVTVEVDDGLGGLQSLTTTVTVA